jgi:diguanylate cyclase (GGDEF)-like protein
MSARDRRLLAAVRIMLDASRRSSGDVLAVLDRLLRELDNAVDSVVVFVPQGEQLACVYAGGLRAHDVRALQLRRDDERHLPVKAAGTGRPALMPIDGAALLPTDRFAMAVPMIDARVLRAVTYVSSSEERRSSAPALDSIVRTVEHAATPYAIALEREADRADATYDGLTGLLSPRAFRRHLDDEVARHRVLCLWFVDTDRFKDVNDAFGHRAGDAVLRSMASLLLAHVDPDAGAGVAARNGGDEFCALLRGVNKGVAIERAQAFCDEVRGHDFGLPVRVTASVGVATYPRDASSASELLETADAAMYHSKREGRDRVSFVVELGRFSSLRAEAASALSRNSPQWRSNLGESCAQRSSP